jgi:hypothetical protein
VASGVNGAAQNAAMKLDHLSVAAALAAVRIEKDGGSRNG